MSLAVNTSWTESADRSIHEVTARAGHRAEKGVWPLVGCLFKYAKFKYVIAAMIECTVHHILVLINCEYRYHSGSSVCPNSFHSTRVPHSFWYTGDQLVPINIQLHLGRNIVLSHPLATNCAIFIENCYSRISFMGSFWRHLLIWLCTSVGFEVAI